MHVFLLRAGVRSSAVDWDRGLLSAMEGKTWSQFFEESEKRDPGIHKSSNCDNVRLKKEGEQRTDSMQSMCTSHD